MNDDTQRDPLDELLKQQPIQPSHDFTAKTLARIQDAGAGRLSEEELDRKLDAWLAAHEATPSEDFSKHVMREATAKAQDGDNDERKVLGFPTWVVTLTGLAAALVAGVFAFHTLFQHGYDQAAKQANAQSTTAEEVVLVATTQPDETEALDNTEVVVETVEVANQSTLDRILAQSPNAVPNLMDILMLEGGPTQAETDVADLILFEESLVEVAALSDTNTLNALAMLVN